MSQALVAALSVDVPITSHEILDNFEGRTGKFIKGFLLNDKRNKNGWKVDWESIKKYAADWINHPGIYYITYGEPDHTGGETYKENMVNQEGYRVVNIVSVTPDESTHTLNYVGEIIDADFEKDYDAGLINMTSPGIWPEEMETVGVMDNGRPKLDVKKHRALHVAYIEKPAYDDVAFTIATCDGDGESCKIRLSAKTEKGECEGLCPANDLGPLMEVPLIKKTLHSQYTPCEIKDFHAEFIAKEVGTDCVGDKLKIIMEDNQDMEKDQQLAIAYSYCQTKGMAELVSDIDNKEDVEWITVNHTAIPIEEGQDKDQIVKDFIDNQKDSTPTKENKNNKDTKTTENTKQKNEKLKQLFKDTEKVRNQVMEDALAYVRENDLVSELYKKSGFDPKGFQIDDNLRGIFNHYTVMSVGDNPEGLKAMWEDLAARSPKIKKQYAQFLKNIESANALSQEQFKTAPTFFRGTSLVELDSYLKNKRTGTSKSDDPYNLRYKFTAVTPNEEMAQIYDSGVTIEYDGDDVRKNGEPVTYDPFFQQMGTNTETKKEGKMYAYYMDQAEVRMDSEVSLSKLGIKTIKIKSNDKSLIKKYSSLGKVILTPDEE